MSISLEFATYCKSLDLKFTPLRKDILYILWHAKKPLKAYEILEKLLETKNNSTPPTVYRVLIFFLESGIVHKIESIQSYTLCSAPKKQFSSELLMVCNDCHSVSEIYDAAMRLLILKLTDVLSFQLSQDAIELKGSCKSCSMLKNSRVAIDF